MGVCQINMIRYLKFRLNWASWTLPMRSGEGRAPDTGEPLSPLEKALGNWGKHLLPTWPP